MANYIYGNNNLNSFSFLRILTLTTGVDNLTIIFFYVGGIFEMWETKFVKEGLTFDDVLLVPAHSEVLPKDVIYQFN